MKIAVAVKMPKRALAAMNSTSGPMSSASLSSGLSLRLPGADAVMAVSSAPTWDLSSRQTRDGRGKISRRERREIVHTFADADEVHRQFVLGRDRDQDAAAGGAVELGHHETGDAGGPGEFVDLRERVLPDGGVEHQQDRMRRAGVQLLHHPHDLLELPHERRLVLQPAGGVDDQHVAALAARRLQRLERERGSVGTLRARGDLAAGALAPDPELLDRGGAESVARRQHDAAALGAKARRELADGRGLARAVDPDDQDDERPR